MEKMASEQSRGGLVNGMFSVSVSFAISFGLQQAFPSEEIQKVKEYRGYGLTD